MRQQNLSVTYEPTNIIIPYLNNSRTHSDNQIDQVAASIQEFGFTNPILIDENKTVIAGHGRLLAAKKINLDEVPTITLHGLTEAQRKAYVIADNKLALNAGWDDQALQAELERLQELDFDLDLTGFDVEELAKLLEPEQVEGLTDEDAVPDVPEEPVSREGDIWVCGNHKIICGDSTNPQHIENLLGSVKPHLMVTDPPYGVEYDANWRNNAKRADGSVIGGSALGQVKNDDRADWSDAWALFEGDVAYVWHADRFSHVVAESLENNNFEMRALIVWAKNNMVIGRGHYHNQHEPCWYAVKKGGTGHWSGDRKQKTLWHIDKPMKSETGHSTQKPVDCMRKPIENNSSVGQAVYEPFSGSGTTMIACEQTGRHCYAVELNPVYVDIAVKRWQDFTGKKAILESTDQTFDEVSSGKKR